MPDPPPYLHGHHDSVLRAHRWRTAANSAAYLLEHLRPGMDLVDVGCGPGTITADLAAAVAPGRLLAVDAAPDVVADAARALVDRPNARAAVGDACALDLPAQSVDVVHAHQVLQHLARPTDALAEWRRVVRPGGLVAARDVDYSSMTWWPADPLLDRWLDLYRVAARASGGEPDAGRRLCAWAHAAGFEQVHAGASAWCFTDEADRHWWADTWATRVTDSRLARTIVEGGLARADELAAVADAFRRWADHDDAWFAMLHGEILCRMP